MKTKHIISLILALLMMGLVIYIAVRETDARATTTETPSTTTAAMTEASSTTTAAPTTTETPTTAYINPDYLDRIAPEEGFFVAASAEVKGKAFDYVVYELINKERSLSVYNGGLYYDVVVLKNGTFLCVLHPQGWEMMGSGEQFPVIERDVDFDGKPDVLLFTGRYGNQAGAYYDCWLQRDSKLVHCPSFYRIMNPAVSDKTKEILGSARGSAATHYYTKYKFINGEFVPTEQLVSEPAGWNTPEWELQTTPETRPDGSNVIWAWRIEDYVNGEWILREYFTENDYDEETLAKKVCGKDSPWDIYSDRWRALHNDGLMADFSIYG